MAVALLLSGIWLLAAPAGASAEPPGADRPAVLVAVVPDPLEATDLARVPGMSVGLVSPGVGGVPASQTYLDITQGARISRSLYREDLPVPFDARGRLRERAWERIRRRAETPPGEIVPGLLATALTGAGIPVQAAHPRGQPMMLALNTSGEAAVRPRCRRGRCPGLTIVEADFREVRGLARGIRGDDLLIALQAPPPEGRRQLAIGIAGRGFELPTLTSTTTRNDGLVASIDIAPTILGRFDLDPPGPMTGEPIEAERGRSASEIERFRDRLSVIVPRRGPVVWGNLAIWTALALLAILATRGRAAPTALSMLAVAFMWMPALLLLGGWIWPSELVERLLVGIGGPALAALSLAVLGRYGALALACGVSVVGHAIVLIAGPLPLTLAGPSPGSGSRFFGIGNELQATLGAQLLLGTAAGLVAWRRDGAIGGDRDRVAALAFGLAGLAGFVAFAPSVFGANVGAGITIPAAAAVAAAVALRLSLLASAALVVGAAVGLLATLAAIELVGGESHFSRFVLGAEDSDALLAVLERRLRLTARFIGTFASSPLLWITLGLAAAAIIGRERLGAWLTDRPPALAGFGGALAVGIIGTFANDSGLHLWVLAALQAAAFVAVVWAARPGARPAAG